MVSYDFMTYVNIKPFMISFYLGKFFCIEWRTYQWWQVPTSIWIRCMLECMHTDLIAHIHCTYTNKIESWINMWIIDLLYIWISTETDACRNLPSLINGFLAVIVMKLLESFHRYLAWPWVYISPGNSSSSIDSPGKDMWLFLEQKR